MRRAQNGVALCPDHTDALLDHGRRAAYVEIGGLFGSGRLHLAQTALLVVVQARPHGITPHEI